MLIVISVIIARIERDNRYEKLEHRVSTQEITIGNRPASLSFMFFFFFFFRQGWSVLANSDNKKKKKMLKIDYSFWLLTYYRGGKFSSTLLGSLARSEN